MAKVTDTGIVVPIIFNVILLAGIPFFPKEETGLFVPLLVLALGAPWFLSWLVGRVMRESRAWHVSHDLVACSPLTTL